MGVLILIMLGLLLFVDSDIKKAENEQHKVYSNPKYGISFEYPDNYFLKEGEAGNGERYHYNITLVEDTPGNREMLSGKVAGEGPTAITVDIFQNNLDNLSVEQWIRTTSFSNFKLSDEKLGTTTVGGSAALSYSWDGLYRGDSLIFAHKENIVMLSATYLTAEDAILRDFSGIVSTFELK